MAIDTTLAGFIREVLNHSSWRQLQTAHWFPRMLAWLVLIFFTFPALLVVWLLIKSRIWFNIVRAGPTIFSMWRRQRQHLAILRAAMEGERLDRLRHPERFKLELLEEQSAALANGRPETKEPPR